MDEFHLKQGDTSPAILRRLESAQGPLDLTGAKVTFSMQVACGGRVVVDRQECRVLPDGEVVYYWDAGDTALDGVFDAEFRVTYPDTSVETVPNGAFLRVVIARSIPADED